jgi:TolB-like protein
LRYLFEDCALDTDRRELRRAGGIVPVEPQVFDLLAYLLRHRDRVVTKDDLLTAVWSNRVVSESALTTRLNAVRTALGDSGQAQRLIRTVRGRGLRFVGDVRESSDASEIVRPPLQLPLPDRPSIAVLPFANMSGDPEQDYFADGIAEEILTALSKWRWFLVFARNSTFTFKGKSLAIREIGEALGARYVLEGSVRKANGRVRITTQLIEAATERHIWADRYDRDIGDVFAVQDEITQQVVTAMDPAIQACELDHVARKPLGSLDAWDHFLRGSYHRNLFTPGDAKLALHHFNQAIEIDPHFAGAHARLALLHVNLATLNPSADSPKTLATALQLANRAIALDALDAAAHGAAAYVLVYSRQHEAALQAGRRAVELNANYHPGHYAFGLALLFGGSALDAILEFEMTARLSPRDPAMWAILSYHALALYTARHYEAALDTAERALAERPDAGARTVRIAALARLGRRPEAAAALANLTNEILSRASYLCPFRNTADWEHWCTALEQAGWERNEGNSAVT